MILEIDAGNTRLKWRVSGEQEILRFGCESQFLQKSLLSLKKEIAPFIIRRVRVAHVLGDEKELEIAHFFLREFSLDVEFARAERESNGVRNGYYQANQLGVDRWLAVLAAFDFARTDCCVISCGTAITVDYVDSDGEHSGGYIIPGIQLLKKMLQNHTHQISITNDGDDTVILGRDTSSAASNGMALMVLTGIERIIADLSVKTVYLTGGDAAALMRQLRVSQDVKIEVVRDLVLDGLRLALP